MIKYVILAVVLAAIATVVTIGYNRLEASITETCDLKWQKQISDNSDALEQRVRDRDAKIAELEAKLQTEIENGDEKRKQLDKALEEQKNSVPLSEACNICRIPRDRVWLRASRTPGGIPSGGSPD